MKKNPFCSDICKNFSSFPKKCKGCDYLGEELDEDGGSHQYCGQDLIKTELFEVCKYINGIILHCKRCNVDTYFFFDAMEEIMYNLYEREKNED